MCERPPRRGRSLYNPAVAASGLGQRPFTCPRPLVPGDRIRIIAPSSPFDRTLVLRGMGWLAERYKVEFDPGLFERSGFLAGSDERRFAELNQALQDPTLGALVAARGGYGATRVLYRADWAAFQRYPKWIVGFSDITALHVEASRRSVASLHAHNAAGLGRSDAVTRQRWLDALEAPLRPRVYPGLAVWRAGSAQGVMCGGNLTLLFTCAAAGRLWLPEGGILFIEDVTESSYRIDRMLTALCESGLLDRLAAIVVGEFADCTPGKYAVSVERVIEERLAPLGVPVVAGFPMGHGVRNEAVPLGRWAHVDGARGVVTVCPE